ncbi:hypothetical protein [Cellulomonas denverensis]|uniref:hypothetical protein n=1 Tax=Cellulomonas denverensis TaxID=264297 RepID=UPI0035EA195A
MATRRANSPPGHRSARGGRGPDQVDRIGGPGPVAAVAQRHGPGDTGAHGVQPAARGLQGGGGLGQLVRVTGADGRDVLHQGGEHRALHAVAGLHQPVDPGGVGVHLGGRDRQEDRGGELTAVEHPADLGPHLLAAVLTPADQRAQQARHHAGQRSAVGVEHLGLLRDRLGEGPVAAPAGGQCRPDLQAGPEVAAEQRGGGAGHHRVEQLLQLIEVAVQHQSEHRDVGVRLEAGRVEGVLRRSEVIHRKLQSALGLPGHHPGQAAEQVGVQAEQRLVVTGALQHLDRVQHPARDQQALGLGDREQGGRRADRLLGVHAVPERAQVQGGGGQGAVGVVGAGADREVGRLVVAERDALVQRGPGAGGRRRTRGQDLGHHRVDRGARAGRDVEGAQQRQGVVADRVVPPAPVQQAELQLPVLGDVPAHHGGARAGQHRGGADAEQFTRTVPGGELVGGQPAGVGAGVAQVLGDQRREHPDHRAAVGADHLEQAAAVQHVELLQRDQPGDLGHRRGADHRDPGQRVELLGRQVADQRLHGGGQCVVPERAGGAPHPAAAGQLAGPAGGVDQRADQGGHPTGLGGDPGEGRRVDGAGQQGRQQLVQRAEAERRHGQQHTGLEVGGEGAHRGAGCARAAGDHHRGEGVPATGGDHGTGADHVEVVGVVDHQHRAALGDHPAQRHRGTGDRGRTADSGHRDPGHGQGGQRPVAQGGDPVDLHHGVVGLGQLGDDMADHVAAAGAAQAGQVHVHARPEVVHCLGHHPGRGHRRDHRRFGTRPRRR